MNEARIRLAVALAVVVAVLAVLGAVLPPLPTSPAGSPAEPPVAGGAVCPLGDSVDGAELDLVLATPTATGPAPLPARGTVVVLGDRPGRTAPPPLPPGGVAVVRTDVAAGGLVWTGWADAPIVAFREWRRPGAPGVPRGRAAGACVPADAVAWHVVGLRTDGGAEARLRFANPFAVDATVAVTLVTTEGAVAPIALQNLSVPARGTAELRVNDHVPERADVAAVVRVEAGRAAVEGLQLALAGVGGVDGVTLVPAATAPATVWTLPWIPEDGEAWAWVLNPSERDVELEVTLHGSEGPGLPPGAESVTVPAGRMVRVTAADLVPAGAGAVGITFRSPTDPVVVAGGLRIDPGVPEASGIATLPALPDGDVAWLAGGVASEGRDETVELVNVDEGAVTVAIALRGPDGTTRDLPAVGLPAGARRSVGLPLTAGEAWVVEVVADGEVVVARVGAGGVGAAPDPVAVAGVPIRAGRGSGPSLAGARRDGWTLGPPTP